MLESGESSSGFDTRQRTIKDFFDRSSSQLTFYGLEMLHGYLKERQVAVFFRNNHFSTIIKHNSHLYTLATDSGYRDEGSIVWEKLDTCDGDTELCDDQFRPSVRAAHPTGNLIDPDFLLALKASMEEVPVVTRSTPREGERCHV